MEVFFQAAALTLLAVILSMALEGHAKPASTVLVMLACVMILAAVCGFLQPVLAFIREIRELTNLGSDMMKILLKCVGIGIVAEMAGLICVDAGKASLGKALQILSSVVILWLSVPMFQALLELVQKILEGI